EWSGREIADGVDRIEPQGVDVILGLPVQGVLEEELPDLVAVFAVKIDCCTPRRVIAGGEVVSEVREVISLRTEMVVDDVENDSQAAGMAGVYQPFQSERAAVGVLRCK